MWKTYFVLVGWLLPACVVGAEQPSSRLEVAREFHARSRPTGTAPATGSACLGAAGAPAPPPEQGTIWIDGGYHFDGVRYVWTPGRWEPRAAAYSFR